MFCACLQYFCGARFIRNNNCGNAIYTCVLQQDTLQYHYTVYTNWKDTVMPQKKNSKQNEQWTVNAYTGKLFCIYPLKFTLTCGHGQSHGQGHGHSQSRTWSGILCTRRLGQVLPLGTLTWLKWIRTVVCKHFSEAYPFWCDRPKHVIYFKPV